MVRTIQAIGIVAMLLAGLVFALCVRDHLAEDASLDVTLGAIEQFRQILPGTAEGDTNQVPPLVQQALAFARYLNPPPIPSPPVASRIGTAAATISDEPSLTAAPVEVQPASSSPKFELHGISYYRADPNQSMAMIYEPGGSRRWVRQGERLGHLAIERIERDCMVYQDAGQSRRMALASSNAIRKFARRQDDDRSSLKTARTPRQSTPAPPPVRGLRQMPPSRVAAKLGRRSLETGLANPGQAETP